MDDRKFVGIQGWEEPQTMQEVRSFLGLANYYCMFVESYSRITTPLTELLKKNNEWKWSKKCQGVFDEM